MDEYQLTKGVNFNLRVLAARYESLSKEYDAKKIRTLPPPHRSIHAPGEIEEIEHGFRKKAEAYRYAARELTNLLNWYGVPELPSGK